MKVFERFTRKGDEMLYEVTVEDPHVLLQPWKQNPMLMTKDERRCRRRWPGNATLIGAERGSLPGTKSSTTSRIRFATRARASERRTSPRRPALFL